MTGRVEHVITGLGIGGAELMLSHLVRGSTRFAHSVTERRCFSRPCLSSSPARLGVSMVVVLIEA